MKKLLALGVATLFAGIAVSALASELTRTDDARAQPKAKRHAAEGKKKSKKSARKPKAKTKGAASRAGRKTEAAVDRARAYLRYQGLLPITRL